MKEIHTIEFVDSLPRDAEEQMDQGYMEYENTHGINVNYKKFALLLRNEKGIAVGVLSAYTAFAEIYVEDIWVDKAYRGKGYGKKLLNELEKHFKGKGFNNINLVTSAFQAPEFYKKCGFTEEFVRVNKINPQFTKTFFVKYFEDKNQFQGIRK
jgi:ribosomal protein S18 acetylase RimI-like enzyme